VRQVRTEYGTHWPIIIALDYMNTHPDDPHALQLDEGNHLFVASLYNAAIVYVSDPPYSRQS
jgi:hypothetical protein